MYTFFLTGNKSTFPLWRNHPSYNLLLDSKFICTYVNKHVPSHTHADEKHMQIYIEPSDNIVAFIFSTLQKSLPPAYGKYFKSQKYVHKRLPFSTYRLFSLQELRVHNGVYWSTFRVILRWVINNPPQYSFKEAIWESLCDNTSIYLTKHIEGFQSEIDIFSIRLGKHYITTTS